MRARLLVATFLFVAPFITSGAAQSQPDTPTFRAGTTLIELTVVVTDADGKPVKDLQEADISITEGGRPRSPSARRRGCSASGTSSGPSHYRRARLRT